MSRTIIEQHREFLHELLCRIKGVKAVYFQPPESIKLKYPCIIYSLDSLTSKYANDKRYISFPRYSITLIDFNPESMIQKSILDLNENCYVSFDRFYTSDNLNHWVYELYFTKSLW